MMSTIDEGDANNLSVYKENIARSAASVCAKHDSMVHRNEWWGSKESKWAIMRKLNIISN